MSDFNKPVTTDLYADVLAYERALAADCISLADSRRTAPTNLPDYAKRWNNTAAVFENWLSSAWTAIVLAIAGGGTGATTAAGARTNLGVPSTTDLSNHTGGTGSSVHGATSEATASAIIARDGAARAKVAAPSANDDIARLQEISDHAAVTAAHGATVAATANRIALRDASGRAQFNTPASYYDAVVLGTLNNHTNAYSAHGATTGATGGRIVLRDAYGRAQFVDPSAPSDAATKAYVDSILAAAIAATTPRICNISKSADQSCPQNVMTPITFDVENSDALGAHTGAGSNIVVPSGYSYIRINAHLSVYSINNAQGFAHFFKNGAEFCESSVYVVAQNESSVEVNTGWVPCSVNDYFYITFFQMNSNSTVKGNNGAFIASYMRAEFK